MAFPHFSIEDTTVTETIRMRNINATAEEVSSDTYGRTVTITLPGDREYTFIAEEFESLAYLFAHLSGRDITEDVPGPTETHDGEGLVCAECEKPGYLTLYEDRLMCQNCQYLKRNGIFTMTLVEEPVRERCARCECPGSFDLYGGVPTCSTCYIFIKHRGENDVSDLMKGVAY